MRSCSTTPFWFMRGIQLCTPRRGEAKSLKIHCADPVSQSSFSCVFRCQSNRLHAYVSDQSPSRETRAAATGLAVGFQSDFRGPLTCGNFVQEGIGIFRVAPRLAIGAPFDVDEPLDSITLGQQALLVIRWVVSAVPSGPDGGRVYIRNIAREVTTAKRGKPGVVQAVGQVAHLGEEAANGLLIDFGKLIGPVVLVTEPPEDDGGDGYSAGQSCG